MLEIIPFPTTNGNVEGADMLAGAEILNFLSITSVYVGRCYHGMARPQVADGGTASDMEGSCE